IGEVFGMSLDPKTRSTPSKFRINIQSPDTREQSGKPVFDKRRRRGTYVALDPQE
ncbi:hypothetical protein Tco_0384467, partial [Tanacetum coccineum]